MQHLARLRQLESGRRLRARVVENVERVPAAVLLRLLAGLRPLEKREQLPFGVEFAESPVAFENARGLVREAVSFRRRRAQRDDHGALHG